VSAVLDGWYPWAEPAAQELHRTLTQLFPTAKAAGDVAARAGLDVTAIDLQQPPSLVWHDVLELAGGVGLTRAVVETARGLRPATSPGRPVLDAVLADRAPAVEPGAGFLAASDEVQEPEALLYHDSLLLSIGRVPALIATLGRLLAVAPSVCRLETGFPGGAQLGTGLLIAPDLVLTCWHVLHMDGRRAVSVAADFGYEDDERDAPRAATAVRGLPATIAGNAGNDWAVVRVDPPPGAAWPVASLRPPGEPVLHAPAYLIQHPGGIRKRLGFVRNWVSHVDDRVVQYLTDTQTGSSGAPVLDGDGRIIALHHAGGVPQEVAGMPPAKKNEGVRLSRILADFPAAGVELPVDRRGG
jgi:hypothetical protein